MMTTKKGKTDCIPTQPFTGHNERWSVPYLHSISDIKTLFHPNRELWPPKKEKRTVSQPNWYIEKEDKTKPFSIPTENSALISKKTRKNRASSQQRILHGYIKIESFSIPTENFASLHQKRQEWTVPHAPTKNSALLYRRLRDWTVPHSLSDIKTLFHPNRELWPPKKEKLTVFQPNCSPYQQRTLHCYIENDNTEPFPIPTENSTLLARKRPDWTIRIRLTFLTLSKINRPTYIYIYRCVYIYIYISI